VKIIEMLTRLSYVFNFPDVDQVVPVFMTLLAGYEIGAVGRAFAEYAVVGRRMPVPADILNLINGGSAADRAARSWPLALRLLNQGPSYHNTLTLLPDGAAAAAVQALASAGSLVEERFFKHEYVLQYEEGSRNGLSHVAGEVFFSKRDDGFLSKPGDAGSSKFLAHYWWPPELWDRHRQALDHFMSDWREHLESKMKKITDAKRPRKALEWKKAEN
jgi:hypothetical protein